MTTLANQRLFLSASFPSGPRGEPFQPYDVAAIADAVTALTRAVLAARGTLVFGAHPTISPLVLMVASELDHPPPVEIYQSRHFEERIPEETRRLIESGLGTIRWTPADPNGDRDESLRRMREEMLSSGPLAAALFVGGMEGVVDEYESVGERKPPIPRLALWAPGGAARRLPPGHHPVEVRLAESLKSRRYPALAREVVAALAEYPPA